MGLVERGELRVLIARELGLLSWIVVSCDKPVLIIL